MFTIFDLRIYTGPLTHGRKYSENELWDNYTYFIRQIAPVAEEAGVRIGIHPDDPPVPELGGIPRHMFGTFDGYARALEIADSPNIGVCLCCGTWAAHEGIFWKSVLAKTGQPADLSAGRSAAAAHN